MGNSILSIQETVGQGQWLLGLLSCRVVSPTIYGLKCRIQGQVTQVPLRPGEFWDNRVLFDRWRYVAPDVRSDKCATEEDREKAGMGQHSALRPR